MPVINSCYAKPVFHRQGRRRQDLGRLCHGGRPRGRGKRVLLVSTDPASNLDEVFGVALGMRPRRSRTSPASSR